LEGNLVKQLFSLYGTEWRECGYGLKGQAELFSSGSLDLLAGMKGLGHGSTLDPIHERQTMEKICQFVLKKM
jgi:hypothetical protein